MLIFVDHINILQSCAYVSTCHSLSLRVSLSPSVCVCVSVCVCRDDRALDFTRVSDESAGVLSPSYDLPYSYMAGVAEKYVLHVKFSISWQN